VCWGWETTGLNETATSKQGCSLCGWLFGSLGRVSPREHLFAYHTKGGAHVWSMFGALLGNDDIDVCDGRSSLYCRSRPGCKTVGFCLSVLFDARHPISEIDLGECRVSVMFTSYRIYRTGYYTFTSSAARGSCWRRFTPLYYCLRYADANTLDVGSTTLFNIKAL
jgi:hypothetical protein